MPNKSAKDLAFDRERAKCQKQINNLSLEIAYADDQVETRGMVNAVIYNSDRQNKIQTKREDEQNMNEDKNVWLKEAADPSKHANDQKTEKIHYVKVPENLIVVDFDLKDSGARREFVTGAVRDISDGKGRCDLLPLDVVGDILREPILEQIEYFKETKNPVCLIDAIILFSVDRPTTMLEASIHYEAGAKKYSENNWKKGIPLHCYIDSGVRHYLKYLRGDTDEPHDRAFVWNLLCALWTLKHKPELDDIEKDIKEENNNE